MYMRSIFIEFEQRVSAGGQEQQKEIDTDTKHSMECVYLLQPGARR